MLINDSTEVSLVIEVEKTEYILLSQQYKVETGT
jgi:hypothetical protein